MLRSRTTEYSPNTNWTPAPLKSRRPRNLSQPPVAEALTAQNAVYRADHTGLGSLEPKRARKPDFLGRIRCRDGVLEADKWRDESPKSYWQGLSPSGRSAARRRLHAGNVAFQRRPGGKRARKRSDSPTIPRRQASEPPRSWQGSGEKTARRADRRGSRRPTAQEAQGRLPRKSGQEGIENEKGPVTALGGNRPSDSRSYPRRPRQRPSTSSSDGERPGRPDRPWPRWPAKPVPARGSAGASRSAGSCD